MEACPIERRLPVGKENNMRLKKGLSALCICLILAMTACDTTVPPADTDAPTESATETTTTPEDTSTQTETETEGETSSDVSAPLDGMDYRVSEHADAVDATEAGYTDRVLRLDTPGLAVNLGKLDLSAYTAMIVTYGSEGSAGLGTVGSRLLLTDAGAAYDADGNAVKGVSVLASGHLSNPLASGKAGSRIVKFDLSKSTYAGDVYLSMQMRDEHGVWVSAITLISDQAAKEPDPNSLLSDDFAVVNGLVTTDACGVTEGTLTVSGWVGFNKEIDGFGYILGKTDETRVGDCTYEGATVNAAERAVVHVTKGGPLAKRFTYTIDVSGFAQGVHTFSFVVRFTDGTVGVFHEYNWGNGALALNYSASSSYRSGKYYRQLMAVAPTGNPRVDIVNIAKSQIGYYEGNNSSQLSGMTGGKSNYTEYGHWYGLQDQWCAMFVSWCANVAGVDGNTIQRHAYTENGLNQFKKQGRAYSRADILAGKYTPQAGDIIYFLSSSGAANGRSTNHVGIVTGYSNGTIYTIEGNTSSSTALETNGGLVAAKSYSMSNSYIVYVCSPDY